MTNMPVGYNNEGYVSSGGGVKGSGLIITPFGSDDKNHNVYITDSEEQLKRKKQEEEERKRKKKEEDWTIADIKLDEGEPFSELSTNEKIKLVCLNILKVCTVLGLLYLFICSLDLLSSSFRLIAGKTTGEVLNNDYVTNPIVGLMIGILVTVLVQSSSTSTSIIVSMVAAEILDVPTAIPMIMGSNIGTSVTNTIVSLTQVGNKDEFRRAFAGATVHDMFNWLAVIVLLIIEIITGMLFKMTEAMVNNISFGKGSEVKILKEITEELTNLIIRLDKTVMSCWGMDLMQEEDSMIKKYCKYDTVQVNASIGGALTECEPDPSKVGISDSCNFLFYNTGMSDMQIGIILLIISLVVLCTALIIIVKILNSMLKGSIAVVIRKTLNADIPYVPWLTGYIAIIVGAIMTFIVQSSSIFTSTLTPLIGIGIISVERSYPLTLGSNIGTTTTALLASMAGSGESLRYSIQIALVHLFFNIFGIMLFYPIPFMRFPIPMCKALGNITAEYRWFAIFYLIFMFFLLPGLIFSLSLGGPVVLWAVLGPIIFFIIVIVVINTLQNKKPQWLPTKLHDWSFLPIPLRSLDPYDRVFTALPCCKVCRKVPESPQGLEEVVHSNRSSCSSRATIINKDGIDNPVEVGDHTHL